MKNHPFFSQQICHTSTRYTRKKDFFFFLSACYSFVAQTDSFIIARRAHSAIKRKKKKKELIRCSVTVVNIKHSFPLGHSLHFIIHLRACCMEMNKFCLTMTWNVNTCVPTASVYPFKGEFEMRRVASMFFGRFLRCACVTSRVLCSWNLRQYLRFFISQGCFTAIILGVCVKLRLV